MWPYLGSTSLTCWLVALVITFSTHPLPFPLVLPYPRLLTVSLPCLTSWSHVLTPALPATLPLHLPHQAPHCNYVIPIEYSLSPTLTTLLTPLYPSLPHHTPTHPTLLPPCPTIPQATHCLPPWPTLLTPLYPFLHHPTPTHPYPSPPCPTIPQATHCNSLSPHGLAVVKSGRPVGLVAGLSQRGSSSSSPPRQSASPSQTYKTHKTLTEANIRIKWSSELSVLKLSGAECTFYPNLLVKNSIYELLTSLPISRNSICRLPNLRKSPVCYQM